MFFGICFPNSNLLCTSKRGTTIMEGNLSYVVPGFIPAGLAGSVSARPTVEPLSRKSTVPGNRMKTAPHLQRLIFFWSKYRTKGKIQTFKMSRWPLFLCEAGKKASVILCKWLPSVLLLRGSVLFEPEQTTLVVIPGVSTSRPVSSSWVAFHIDAGCRGGLTRAPWTSRILFKIMQFQQKCPKTGSHGESGVWVLSAPHMVRLLKGSGFPWPKSGLAPSQADSLGGKYILMQFSDSEPCSVRNICLGTSALTQVFLENTWISWAGKNRRYNTQTKYA